jgi:hypothetical protein
MKRMNTVGLIVISLILSGESASAATKATSVTAAFKNLLTATSKSLESLEQKYGADIDALDAALVAATKSADDTYNKDLLAITNLYAPQIVAANKRAENAKATYEANNKILLTTGFFAENDRLNALLDCLPPKDYFAGKLLKRYCAAVDGIPTFGTTGYGGEDWQKGDITTIALRNADDKYVAIGIEKGYIIPVNLVAFDSSRSAYKQALTDSANLSTLDSRARESAENKRDNAVGYAAELNQSAKTKIEPTYRNAKQKLEVQISAANSAIRAAKRAGKNSSVFDKAFVTAYKFEYNAIWLDDAANLPLSSLITLRSLLSQFAIIELADKAAGVNSNYSYLAAEKINKSLGSVFTVDEDFQTGARLVAAQYKKIFKVSLKF